MKKIVLTLTFVCLILGKSVAAFTSSARDFSGLKISPFLLSIGTALTDTLLDISTSFDNSAFSTIKYENDSVFIEVEANWYPLLKIDTLDIQTLLEQHKATFGERFEEVIEDVLLHEIGGVANSQLPSTILDENENPKEITLSFTEKKMKTLMKYSKISITETDSSSNDPSFSWSDSHLSYNMSPFLLSITVFLSLILLLYIPYLIGLWKVFEKAGQPGWVALIPFYNIAITLKIIDRPLWWLVLYLIPGAAMVIRIVILHDLSKSFGKDAGYTIGLYFLSFIFFPILGFGNAKYQGPRGIL